MFSERPIPKLPKQTEPEQVSVSFWKYIGKVKWISDTVLSNFFCHATLADTPDNLVHNTKNLFYVKLYY